MKYDWRAIRSRFLAGEKISHISRDMGGKPSVSAIWKKAQKENWEAFREGNPKANIPLRPDQDETKGKVLEFLAQGATLKLAAQAAGIHPDTLTNWRKSNPDFRDACDQARGRFAADHLAVIDQAGRAGDVKASQWLIERHPETRADYAPIKGEPGGGGIQIVLNIPRSEAEVLEYKANAIEGQAIRVEADE